MKREFDIEKIGRKMPYTAPKEEFFENFKSRMMEEVSKDKPQPKRGYIRLLVPMIAVAASLMVGLFIVESVDHKTPREQSQQLLSESIDDSIDSYFNNLSDDELAYLVSSSSSQDDFYLTLPTNE